MSKTYQKALSLHDVRLVYWKPEGFDNWIHVIDAQTGEGTCLSSSTFRAQYVMEAAPNLPPQARAILHAAPGWFEWRDRQK